MSVALSNNFVKTDEPGGAHPNRVVALGGGHGLSATLKALRSIDIDPTAVVTVADDGGSSGRLRREFDCLPPGDLRMALAALCDDSTDWGTTWRDVLQHRFKGQGELDNHALGNLLILALWQLLEDDLAGLDWVGRLLNIHGRVVPMSSSPLVIEADSWQGDNCEHLSGQAAVAKATGCVKHLAVVPADADAHPEAVRAIDAADWVLLGPGSWYTSVLPHLLLPAMHRALVSTKAKKAVIMNLGTAKAETVGMGAADLLEALEAYAPDLRIDAVICDPRQCGDRARLVACTERMGGTLMEFEVSRDAYGWVHDPLLLGSALKQTFESLGA